MPKKIIPLIILLFFVIAIVYFGELCRIEINKSAISIKNWPASNNGLKVAVLADFHIGSYGFQLDKLKEIVSLTNKQKPDIVLLLGDYLVNEGPLKHQYMPEPIANELKHLKAKYGVVAVLGNHDWWVDGERTRKAFEDDGIIVLENKSIKVSTDNGSFWIAGLADMITRDVDVKGTLEQVNDDSPVILLSHSPDIFPEIPEQVCLTLAGHTHGGQVILPFIGRPVVPSKFKEKYALGHIIEGERQMIVSTGLGNSILPLRIATKPEILILELVTTKE